MSGDNNERKHKLTRVSCTEKDDNKWGGTSYLEEVFLFKHMDFPAINTIVCEAPTHKPGPSDGCALAKDEYFDLAHAISKGDEGAVYDGSYRIYNNNPLHLISCEIRVDGALWALICAELDRCWDHLVFFGEISGAYSSCLPPPKEETSRHREQIIRQFIDAYEEAGYCDDPGESYLHYQ